MISETNNVFTGKISKIALSTNDDKIIKSIDSIETYEYGTIKDIVIEKEGSRSKRYINNTKLINVDDATRENIKKHNTNLATLPDNAYKNINN